MRDFAKSIPSETDEGSPGPFEKNTPSGLLDRTSFREEREVKPKLHNHGIQIYLELNF